MIFAQAVRVIVLTAVSFVIALMLTPFWYGLLRKFNMKKQIRSSAEAPIFSKLHQAKSGTPTAGGVIIWTTVIGLAAIFWVLHRIWDGPWAYFNFINRAETYLPLATLLITALIGLLDDWLGVLKLGGSRSGGLKIRHKLLLYTLVAVVGAWWFYFRLNWDVLTVPLLGSFHIGAWYIPIFIFIIVASAFSANETDGLDGLLGGVSLFGFVALTVVAFALHRYDLAALGGAIVGSLLAFLWFNIYPAKFFMGDTGAMSLGITMGIIAMLTNTALLLPLFAIIMVIESVSVLLQLGSKKFLHRKLFLSSPLHHHFEAKGWPESQVTMRFWIISAIACTLGLVIFFMTQFA